MPWVSANGRTEPPGSIRKMRVGFAWVSVKNRPASAVPTGPSVNRNPSCTSSIGVPAATTPGIEGTAEPCPAMTATHRRPMTPAVSRLFCTTYGFGAGCSSTM